MLKGAIIGTGFWANFQIPAWQELERVKIVALYNRTLSKAVATGKKFGINNCYDDVAEMLNKERLDFVDIITDVDTHPHFVRIAADNNLNVICQKPLASSFSLAADMVAYCKARNVQFYIHENFRWQLPVRKLKEALDSGIIGRAFKARVSFCSAFPVFDNQPFLKELEHFILTDVGSHVLDICRFLFGEAKELFCLTKRINPQIKGEDVANVLLSMKSGLHCYAEMSYASIMEKESFPQTLVFIEGENGSLHLTNDFELRIILPQRTSASVIIPKMYEWADPDYAVVHSSIVDCNADILKGLQGGKSENTDDENLKTVQLVWASYESAATGKSITLQPC